MFPKKGKGRACRPISDTLRHFSPIFFSGCAVIFSSLRLLIFGDMHVVVHVIFPEALARLLNELDKEVLELIPVLVPLRANGLGRAIGKMPCQRISVFVQYKVRKPQSDAVFGDVTWLIESASANAGTLRLTRDINPG